MALDWAEALPSSGGERIEAWVVEIALERWHERVDGAQLRCSAFDGSGDPLGEPFELHWDSSVLGSLAPAAIARFGDGRDCATVLRWIAGRLVLEAVARLDSDLLRAGAPHPPTLWVSGDGPPALRLGSADPEDRSEPPAWFE
jgi:hypothetical protein